ncbi:platelet-activating factor acetylhydrolase, isoform II-domain-containing protein [Rhodofomes roseus]|uniref:1-alkyl-2-acetylglycerophosphocholine esterase n=1 Tax=Rhodofomes roseus TaxID=34475 RepID=A0ABQ8KXT0_9APHY|nr:platelet-activating factor acetylhydrolase, isoform II-domain-containing protein [Rhodofomes roseus]KAH9844109.1 platelet-activating factor acetylhydrolase, isoform II-domain-containing protein [Rhodofomes roseus]
MLWPWLSSCASTPANGHARYVVDIRPSVTWNYRASTRHSSPMFHLPDVPGRFQVGATTFALPLNDPQVFGAAKLAKSSGNTPHEPALLLEEVVFTAFYPADINSPSADGTPPEKLKKSLDWILRPVHSTLRGYAHFAKVPFWFTKLFVGAIAPRLKLPVYPNTALLDPAEVFSDPEAQWPVVFHSHGLSGTRTTYSHLCVRIASEGNVVIAVEHRDGTAPVVTSHFAATTSTDVKGKKKHKPKVKYYLHPEDVMYDDGEEPPHSRFRVDQLLFRELELYLAYRGLADLVNSHPRAEAEKLAFGGIYYVRGYTAHELPRHGPFWKSWTAGRVKLREKISIMGHSFGGSLVLSVLSNPPPAVPGTDREERLEALPLTHALVLDPWLEPLPSPGPAPRVEATRDARAPQVLIINSEEFTLWRNHFARLLKVVHEWQQPNSLPGSGDEAHSERRHSSSEPEASGSRRRGGDTAMGVDAQGDETPPAKLVTLIRAKHVSFSDFSVIWPIGHVAPSGRVLLRMLGDLALAFFNDDLGATLDGLPKREMEEEHRGSVKSTPPGRRKRRLKGSVGEIIVH